MNAESEVNGLSRNPLFTGIPESVLDELSRTAQKKIVPAHNIIFQQGEPGDCFYIINEGSVRVFRKGKEGLETDLAILGPGDSFGEMALLTGEPRTGYVESVVETHLTVITKEQFDRILNEYPHVSSIFLKKLSNWLKQTDVRLQKETERKLMVPRLSIFDIVMIMGLSLLFAFIFNSTNPNGIRLIPKLSSDISVSRISISKALEKYSEGNAVFIDAMPTNYYEQKHISGSINLPLSLFDIMYMLGLGETDREKEIIVYGRTISRLYDEEVARKLIIRGHTKTMILEGGLSLWEKSGCPIEQ